MTKLVHGVGINDAGYTVARSSRASGKCVQLWICPFYNTWKGMLERGYSEKCKKRCPTYRDVTVCEEWHRFSNFRAWMIEQDWEGKQIDKDLLVEGNKIYSPTTCVFVSKRTNTFCLESNASRGEWPVGVYRHKRDQKFVAAIGDLAGMRRYIGAFGCPLEAHRAWLKEKRVLAVIIAAEQSDPRVAEAIIKRYENYKLEGRP